MFSAASSSPFGRPGNMAMAYRQMGVASIVDSATPHHLIELLFDGYIEAVNQARGAMRARQVEAKGKAISRAARIIDEGLKASLNLTEGGELAADLRNLYEYVALRLVLANVRNDETILDECTRLIEPLRQAWKEIRPEVGGVN